MTAHISDDGFKREESVSEHTEKTVYLCKKKGKRCGMANIMTLCGAVHDMGKSKNKFNEYIHADERIRKKLRGTIAHASTGAKYVYEMFHGSEKTGTRVLTEMVSYAVAAHHGIFDCVDRDQTDLFRKKINVVEDYGEAVQKSEEDYLSSYEIGHIFQKASEEFDIIQKKISNSQKELVELHKERYKDENESSSVIRYNMIKSSIEYQKFFYACMQRLILSVLIDSDWEATSDFMMNIDTMSKPEGICMNNIHEDACQHYDSFMEKKLSFVNKEALNGKEKEIFDARNTLQSECKCFARHSAGIYCLPIPTGGGKTLSSLSYALEYCKHHPETERIIYVSPFISITEQNAEVFRQAIGNNEWILEHHSSVVKSENEVEGDYITNNFSQLDINWEEPFICTTFVQFMNALFSERKQSIRLMHRLVNAVVIIDEVQSMPLKCVNTFNYAINFLNVVCNTDIILCTATQPTLEETECPICYGKPKYMIKDASKWFEKFNRVEICLSEKTYTFESLKDEIITAMQQYHSILIVLNTKSAVRKLYDLLDEQGIDVEYLTTNLCAEHRSDKIEKIKEILGQSGKSIVVVSTNLIEAGVDISFECVYRSKTGLDSLAQSAGRCNRNGEKEYGIVHLIKLEGENTGNMEELLLNTDVADQILYFYKKESSGDNLLAPEWMNQFYKLLYMKAKSKMNFPIKEKDINVLQLLTTGYPVSQKINIMNQAYQTVGREYQIIDDNSFGIIVPYKKGEELIMSIREVKDFKQMKKLIRSAQRYTVNVRGNYLRKLEGLIEPISEKIPNLYMVAAPRAYNMKYGITEEWETLII